MKSGINVSPPGEDAPEWEKIAYKEGLIKRIPWEALVNKDGEVLEYIENENVFEAIGGDETQPSLLLNEEALMRLIQISEQLRNKKK